MNMLLPGQHLVLPLVAAAIAGASSVAPPRVDPVPELDGRVEAHGRFHGSAGAPAYGTYTWPVRGEVVRPYDPPETPYGSGHRGIDIVAVLGTPVRAAQDGTVAFAGAVAGSLFVSIDHPDGVRTTYSWLSEVSVRAGEPVRRGSVIGRSGPGHPGLDPPHLHFGARFAGEYIDPMLLLGGGSLVGLVRLAPVDGP
jgi:murein DD-endopeptidase MepM/ murein hydrolase activator NlpD